MRLLLNDVNTIIHLKGDKVCGQTIANEGAPCLKAVQISCVDIPSPPEFIVGLQVPSLTGQRVHPQSPSFGNQSLKGHRLHDAVSKSSAHVLAGAIAKIVNVVVLVFEND